MPSSSSLKTRSIHYHHTVRKLTPPYDNATCMDTRSSMGTCPSPTAETIRAFWASQCSLAGLLNSESKGDSQQVCRLPTAQARFPRWKVYT